MTLTTALKKFLIVVERDACFSHKTWDYTTIRWTWNEAIWKENDPTYYKHWKRLADMVGGIPLTKV